MSNDDDLAKQQIAELVTSVSAVADEAKTSVTSAKDAALVEIDQTKSDIATAKKSLDAALIEFNTSKAAVETSSSAAIGEIDRSRNSVKSSKNIVDAALGEIDRAKNAATESRGAIQESQKASSADAVSIHQNMKTVNDLRAKAVSEAEDLAAKSTTVSDKIKELQEKADALESILATITNSRDEAEKQRVSVETDVAKIGDVRTNFEALNSQTQQQHDSLVARKITLDTQISEIESTHARAQEIYKTLFDETDGKKSFNAEVEELRKKVALSIKESSEHREDAQAFFAKFKVDTEAEKKNLSERIVGEFGELRATLESEIRALLPSAGAAGLASTYYDAKSRYAPTSFAGRLGAGTSTSGILGVRDWFRSKLGYNPASVVATVFFYILFIAPILGIVIMFYELVRQLPDTKLAALDFRIVTLRILIAVPLATISAFGFASLRSYRRLYEEYNHKQRVMELYASFRKEISENGTEDQKKQLLTIMLDAVADKSYLAAASKDDKNQDELLARVNGLITLLNNVAKLKT